MKNYGRLILSSVKYNVYKAGHKILVVFCGDVTVSDKSFKKGEILLEILLPDVQVRPNRKIYVVTSGIFIHTYINNTLLDSFSVLRANTYGNKTFVFNYKSNKGYISWAKKKNALLDALPY